MKKMIFTLTIFVVMIIAFVVYWNNDGWINYNIQKKQLSELELINYYTNIRFPDTTNIESCKFIKDTPGVTDECLKAILIIPSNEIDNLFPEKVRNYNTSFVPIKFNDNDESLVYFWHEKYNTVRKWFTKTQRSIDFAVLKPEGDHNKIYVSVSKLGWYLWNKQQLGGE